MSPRAPSKSVFDSQCGNKWDSSVRLFLHHITCPLCDKYEHTINPNIEISKLILIMIYPILQIILITLPTSLGSNHILIMVLKMDLKGIVVRNGGLVLVGASGESGDMD